MKIMGIDVTLKYIIYTDENGEDRTVSFRYNPIKGIYDVIVFKDGQGMKTKVISVYPPITQVVQTLWWRLRSVIRRLFQRLRNRSSLS